MNASLKGSPFEGWSGPGEAILERLGSVLRAHKNTGEIDPDDLAQLREMIEAAAVCDHCSNIAWHAGDGHNHHVDHESGYSDGFTCKACVEADLALYEHAPTVRPTCGNPNCTTVYYGSGICPQHGEYVHVRDPPPAIGAKEAPHG